MSALDFKPPDKWVDKKERIKEMRDAYKIILEAMK